MITLPMCVMIIVIDGMKLLKESRRECERKTLIEVDGDREDNYSNA